MIFPPPSDTIAESLDMLHPIPAFKKPTISSGNYLLEFAEPMRKIRFEQARAEGYGTEEAAAAWPVWTPIELESDPQNVERGFFHGSAPAPKRNC